MLFLDGLAQLNQPGTKLRAILKPAMPICNNRVIHKHDSVTPDERSYHSYVPERNFANKALHPSYRHQRSQRQHKSYVSHRSHKSHSPFAFLAPFAVRKSRSTPTPICQSQTAANICRSLPSNCEQGRVQDEEMTTTSTSRPWPHPQLLSVSIHVRSICICPIRRICRICLIPPFAFLAPFAVKPSASRQSRGRRREA